MKKILHYFHLLVLFPAKPFEFLDLPSKKQSLFLANKETGSQVYTGLKEKTVISECQVVPILG